MGGCFVTSYYPPPSDPSFELKIDLDKHGVVVVDVETAYVSPEIGYGVSFVTVSAHCGDWCCPARGHRLRPARDLPRRQIEVVRVMKQLQPREAFVVFGPSAESVNIVLASVLDRLAP